VTSEAKLNEMCVNTIRFLSIDAIQKANSGHPGLPMGAAPMAYTLWTRFLKHNPRNPAWFDRDRFVLSGGHGSMLLYSLLYLTGYDLSLDDIRNFRQWKSATPGHPERGAAPGIETTTGPLGQGFGNAVGMAIAERHLAACFNQDGFPVVNHFTYVFAGDGDLMEGVASEAASLAGHLKLGKLICFYDDNRITLAGATSLSFTEDVALRFKAYGWQVLSVDDGNDINAIGIALHAARAESNRPSLIRVRTHIGFGSPHKQDTFEAHGSPLGEDEVRLTKKWLGWPVDPPFYVPDEVLCHFRNAVEAGGKAEAVWNNLFTAYRSAHPELAEEFNRAVNGELPRGWEELLPVFPADTKGIATRAASGKVLNALAPLASFLMGGSADLNPSTNTALKGLGDFLPLHADGVDTQGSTGGGWSYAGRNIHFGVREHGMGAILNGLSAHGGIIPFGATFLIFADYMRPSIRLAALMKLGVIYVFTHDSIGVGEDGPTHQPVEHVASLRTIPGLVVIRPCDANETAVAWRTALLMRDSPTALVLTRQNVPTLDRTICASAEGLARGAYILSDTEKPDLLLIGSGSEVHLLLAAQTELRGRGINARVISMPSWELFEEQPEEYRERILPASVGARLAVEAGISLGWHRYVGNGGAVISIETFGASAPGPLLMRKFGFTVENVCCKAVALLERESA